jgi:hypothetical protein
VEEIPREIFIERAVPPDDGEAPGEEELAALVAIALSSLEIRAAAQTETEPAAGEALSVNPPRKRMSLWKLAGLFRLRAGI